MMLPIVDHLENNPVTFEVPPKTEGGLPSWMIDSRLEALDQIRREFSGWNWPFTREPNEPSGVCIHHAAGWTSPLAVIRAAAIGGKRTTGKVPFSYWCVVGVNGQVYLMNDLDDIVYHNGGTLDPTWDDKRFSEANARTLGVCLVGNFTDNEDPTEEQIFSVGRLIKWTKLSWVTGHKDWKSTACPGDRWHVWREDLIGSPPVREIRDAAWNQVGVRLNTDAAFFYYASKENLGRPVTNEFDLGNTRIQCFDKGIVFAKIGRWDQIKHITWLP